MSQANDTEEMLVRWLIGKDMPRVLKIESASESYPWSNEEFLECLRMRHRIGMVIEPMNAKRCSANGYMIYELHKSRLNVIKMAVNPLQRRRGLGTQMIDRLKSKLSIDRRNRICIEVGERNLGAQLFLRAMGFLCVQSVRGGCDVTCDDVYVMEYRL